MDNKKLNKIDTDQDSNGCENTYEKEQDNKEYIRINNYIEEERISFYKEWFEYEEHFYD